MIDFREPMRTPLQAIRNVSRQITGATGRVGRAEEMKSYRPTSFGGAAPVAEEVEAVPQDTTPARRFMAPIEAGGSEASPTRGALGPSTPGMKAAMDVANARGVGQDIAKDFATGGLKSAVAAAGMGYTDPAALAEVGVRSMMTPSNVLGVVDKSAGAAIGMGDLASKLDDASISQSELDRAVQHATTSTPATRGTLEMSPDVRAAVEAIDDEDFGSVKSRLLGGVTSGVAGLFGLEDEDTQSTLRGKSLTQRTMEALDPSMADKAAVDAQVSDFANNENASSFGNLMGIGTDPDARTRTTQKRAALQNQTTLSPSPGDAGEGDGGDRGNSSPGLGEGASRGSTNEALGMGPSGVASMGGRAASHALGNQGSGNMGLDGMGPGSSSTNDSDNDGGDGDRVICTQMMRLGIITPQGLAIDNAFAREYCSMQLVKGYHFWAKPLVRLMRRMPRWFSERCVAPWATAYSRHCHYRMGVAETDSTGGRIFAKIVMPVCEAIGHYLEMFSKLIKRGQ